jgi:hypothetical protein
MDLYTLDFAVDHPAAKRLDAARLEPLHGATMVVWDAGAGAADGPARATLGLAASEAALRQSRHWRTELAAALAHGAAICAFVPAGASYGVHTLQEVVDFDVLEALPGGAPARSPLAPPQPVRCITGEPFRAFFDAAGDVLLAQAALEAPPGRTICVASDDGRAAGAYDYRHPGHLLILPAVRRDATPADRLRLFHALDGLVRRLRRSGRLGPLAPWAASWSLPGERALQDEAAASAARQREAAAAFDRARDALDVLALMKQLVAGDAAGAGRAAAHALHALGAYSQPGMDDADSVAFEHRGVFGVATLALGEDPAFVDRALRNAAAFAAASGQQTRAALLYCAENALPPDARRGPSEALASAARRADVPVVGADALLQAWIDRDAAILDRLIGGAPPPR